MAAGKEKSELSGSESSILSEFGWNYYSTDAILNQFDSSDCVSNHIDQPMMTMIKNNNNNNIAREKVSAVSSESTPSDSYQPSDTLL